MTLDRPRDRFWIFYLAGLGLAALGCMPENNAPGESTLSGTISGQAFGVGSASADLVDGGEYVVTIADTTEFSCSASSGLPMSYLQIVIGTVDGPGTYEAAGRVFFNVFENGVSESEPAESGSVVIDDIGFGSIDGSINAVGSESQVSGSFSAEICN